MGSLLPREMCWAVAGLVGFGALIRLILFVIYPPVIYPDTGTYMLLAQQIASLDLRAYDGDRTPLYPLLMVLGGLNARGIYLIQALLGIAASVLLFLTALEFKRSYGLAILVGLVPTVLLNQLFMEANILSEHLTGVLAVASLYVGVTMLTRGGGVGSTVVLGLLVAATALARPGYVALVPVYAVVALLQTQQARFARAGVYLGAVCLPIVGWMVVNAATVGQFGLSTRLGLGLMNHSGAFIEYANPRYVIIRDIYLRHRAAVVTSPEAQAHRGGEQYVTIFYALDELKAATGLSQIELSKELQKLSLDLFWRYPDLYAKSVFKAWLSYWSAPNYWRPEAIRAPSLATAMEALWRVEQPLIRLANLALVLAVTLLILQVAVRAARRCVSAIVADRRLLALLLTGGSVFWFAIFQALFEYSENGRYSIPTQQIAVAFVMLYVSWLIDLRRLSGPKSLFPKVSRVCAKT
ncbi:MAG: hypothetical protein H0V78_03955 [Burkholderiales bacterium]|nr:hypothetical protein [Burkholderiales bacterium]